MHKFQLQLWILSILLVSCHQPRLNQSETSKLDLINGQAEPEDNLVSSFPATVSIYGNCTATKVGSRRFILAAHCVTQGLPSGIDATQLRANYQNGGTIYLSNDPNPKARTGSSPWKILTVETTYVHPDWGAGCADRSNCGYWDIERSGVDLALVDVKEDTAEIPSALLDFRTIYEDEDVFVAGYGCENSAFGGEQLRGRFSSKKIQTVSVQTVRDIYPLESLDAFGFRNILTKGVTFDSNAASLCPGDSGGPLYGPKPSMTSQAPALDHLIGVNSYYLFTDDSGKSTFNSHTRLAEAQDWLRSFSWDDGVLGPPEARHLATRGSNSFTKLPDQTGLADIDADGLTDIVKFSDQELRVYSAESGLSSKLSLTLDQGIKQLITGDFAGDRYDQSCLITEDRKLSCYAISSDRRELNRWFSQVSFIDDQDSTVVADFNGDGKDDILVYRSTTGRLAIYSTNSEGFFAPMPAFNLDNLNSAALPGLRFYAVGGGVNQRRSLLSVTPDGQLSFYTSVWDGSQNTFAWAWTSAAGTVGPDESVSVAKIDSDSFDDIALRQQESGATRFLKLSNKDGQLPVIAQDPGQFPFNPNSLLFWGQFKAGHEPGYNRDDALVLDLSQHLLIRSDARFDGQEVTYQQAYSQPMPH